MSATKPPINNDFYHDLGDRWWTATDHMITFLRAESLIKLDYIRRTLPASTGLSILDLGSGAGLIAIPLAKEGHHVTALDCSKAALRELSLEATRQETACPVETVVGNVLEPLPFSGGTFDVVLAMDVLEHIPHPEILIRHAASVLKPGGLLIYHTLNRTLKCRLLYLTLAPMLVRNSPNHIHRHEYNIPPRRLRQWLEKEHFIPSEPVGLHSPIFQRATWELLRYRAVYTPMRFEYTRSLALGYIGHATFALEN